MIEAFVRAAERGDSVFIADVRDAFASSGGSSIGLVIELLVGARTASFELPVPPLEGRDGSELALVKSYLLAEVYNALTTLGANRLVLHIPDNSAEMERIAREVIADLAIDSSRSERVGYGRAVNVIERMQAALDPSRPPSLAAGLAIEPMPQRSGLRLAAEATDVFSRVTTGLDRARICGLDVGGTDIKAALCVDGNLVMLKEHDWNPAAERNVESITGPIVSIVRLMRCAASADRVGGAERRELDSVIDAALPKETAPGELARAADVAESLLGRANRHFDAIGICFPDVVVRNKVVGGEVPKMVGLRSNEERDFDEQFAALTALDEVLSAHCVPSGLVMSINDGPMAAFTAAVELAAGRGPESVARGVFAHSLGTDLGSGYIPADGEIPEIPLEIYNLIVDLGDLPSRTLPSRDLRSLNNSNTGIPGTLQRYTSQTGAFRLAYRLFAERAPQLLDKARELGFIKESGREPILIVPEKPRDMRKAFLAWLMEKARESEVAAAVFAKIGEFLAVAFEETERLLQTGLTERYLFGRLVKEPRCFELMQAGAATRNKELKLIAADSSMAFSPLMRQLDRMSGFTVAQFGQAIGAIHYANKDRQSDRHG